jgi:endonuclease YncB( thermonuclease family)
MVALLLALLAVGCGQREAPPPVPEAASETPARGPLILSPTALDEAFLLARDLPLRWRFLGDRFVLESWYKPLPETWLQTMLQSTGPVYRIEGRWQLLDDGHRFQLRDLQADGPAGLPLAELVVEAGPGDTLIVGGIACLLESHPGDPEVLPDDFYFARLVEALAGDLVEVEHGERRETVQLAGIVCPGVEHAVGRRARERADELMRNRSLKIRIFDQPPHRPRHAQVIVSDQIWANMRLVEEGLAWHDRPSDRQWLLSVREDKARQQRLGIWADPGLLPPWWTLAP